MKNLVDQVKSLTLPQLSFFILYIATISLCLWVFADYLNTVIFAAICAVSLNPLYQFILNKNGGKAKNVALVITWLCFFGVLMISIFLLSWSVFSSLNRIPTKTLLEMDWDVLIQTYINDAQVRFDTVGFFDQIEVVDQIESQIQSGLRQLSLSIFSVLQNIFSSTAEIIIHVLLWFMFVSTFLVQGRSIVAHLIRFSPLSDSLEKTILARTKAMVESIMLGSVVISLVQALAGGILLGLLGVPSAFALTVIMAIVGIIPYVGASLVMLIGVVVLALQSQIWNAVILLLSTVLIISNIDNILRPKLIKKEVGMPDSLMLLAVIGGVGTFGVMGLFYGPILIIWLKTLFESYKQDSYKE